MISLPTFFQKNKPDTRAHRQEPSFRARPNASNTLEDTEVLEDREVQKSRHRLLGASLLLLIAVIGLPKLFDSESKKLNNDVVIQVINSVTHSASSEVTPKPPVSRLEIGGASKKSPSSNPQGDSKKDSPVETASSFEEFFKNVRQWLANIQRSNEVPDIEVTPPKSAANKVDLGKNVPLKNANPQLDVGEEIIAEAPKRTSNEMSKSDNSRFDKTASDSLIASKTENKVEIGGQPEKIEPSKNEKLYIQIAAFSTSERLKKLEEIVNEQKITTYVVERKKDGDSGTLFLLRSGPYKSRDEVFIAEKKLVALGLTPKIVDTK